MKIIGYIWGVLIVLITLFIPFGVFMAAFAGVGTFGAALLITIIFSIIFVIPLILAEIELMKMLINE